MTTRTKSDRTSNSNSPKKTRSIQNSVDPRSPIYTFGEVFSNGATIELIKGGATEPLQLQLFDGKRSTIASQVEFGERQFRPATLSSSIQEIVRFPQKFADFESTTKLFAPVHQLFVGNGLCPAVALAATHFAFATWFADVLPIAPCLLITGPRIEAALLLELLAIVVRHPLPISEFTRRALCTLPMQLQPTLLINTEKFTSASLELLRTSNRHRAFFPVNGNLIDLFCAKALYCGYIADGHVVDECALHIGLLPISGRLPILDRKYGDEIALEIQSKFLAYRCRHILEVRDSEFDLSEFTSGTRILARLLGAPIVNAPGLQSGLFSLLRSHEENRHESQWTDLRCVVVEAVLHHIHKSPGATVYVGEITETVNGIFEGRGDTTEREPRGIGDILKNLGLLKKRKNKGFSILLDSALIRNIHQLAHGLGLLAMRKQETQCSCCKEVLNIMSSKNVLKSEARGKG